MSTPSPADIFLQEAQDLLEQLESALLDLGAQPGNMALIDTAFRALHTIKGSGAMFGFEAVAGFTHHVETAFDLVRQGRLAADERVVAVALAAKDHIRRMILQPQPSDAADGAPILARLEALVAQAVGGGAAPGAAAAAASPGAALAGAPAQGWRIKIRFAPEVMQSGTNPLLLLEELCGLGSARVQVLADDLPAFEDLDPGRCYLAWQVDLVSDCQRGLIEDVFLFVLDEMQLEIAPLPGVAASPPAVAPAALAAAPVPAAVPAPMAAAAGGEAPQRRLSDSLRVPAERLDDLMDRVGELVIAQSRLSQIAGASDNAQFKSIAEDIERLALELRDSTMSVRTVQVGSLFSRFRRLVHDLSVQLGKDIALVTVGEETELDKTVIEKLNEPMIHLIRNSVDHGLEEPAVRLAAGKGACGHITLAARHAGAEVLLSITDDGRGLDRARIRARAEEKGLIQPGAVLSDEELFQVIFAPGFSTAAAVTSLSGRGVGMDVVKQAIESLRGKIEIASTPGQGTELTLRLPLTLAIIDGLLVRIGEGRYVLPLSSVEECVELSAAQDSSSRARNFLNIRGALVPFLRLRELFEAQGAPDPFQKVVVVSNGKQRLGLVVDQVIGNHQTVIKSLSVLHADVRMFSGATILGDGAVALILDVVNLVDFGQSQDERLRRAG